MRYPKHKPAFTLIELLIITSVTVLLATLVIPMYRAQKDKAMGEQCASNLRQIGVAFRLYGNDWDGRFPNCGEGPGSGPAAPGNCKLYTALKLYLPPDGTKLFMCPADTGDAIIGGSATPYYSMVWYSSYAWPAGWGPGWVNGLLQSNPVPPGGSTSWVWHLPLSKRPVLFEHRPWHRVKGATIATDWTNIPGADNTLFCDGHVERAPHNWLVAMMAGTGSNPGTF